MSYQHTPVAGVSEVAELAEKVDCELRRIQESIAGNQRLPTSSVEPARPRAGDVAYADGTNWDPGAGEGMYIYTSAGWTKLQNGSFQPLDSDLTAIAALGTMPFGRSLLEYSSSMVLFNDIKVSATESSEGVVEQATDAEIRAATAGNLFIRASQLASAPDPQTLTDAATVAVNWTAGISFDLTLTANRVLGNPTNEIPRTFRTIVVQGDSSTPRTLTFGNEYLGEVPTLEDITSTVWYELYISCIGTSHFAVSAKKVLGS